MEARLLYSEKQLREKVNELNASNMELEQFAYIASHDLQEPLRKIITFNDRINQRVSSALDDTTRDYLYRTTQAAERMKDLIEDLLNFSRVAKGNSEKSIVDLNSVIQAARENLELTSRNRNVIIAQHHALPKILGDKTQMIRLFQNLLSNAIKFVPKDKTPLVEIFCSVVPKEKMPQREEGYHAETYHKITVKDNGIGFANEFKEKIFVIFQRLHGRSEYEGTGIGLSICRKIVENHEGCIMASSVEGNGAEFYVYLPEVNP